MKLSIRQLRALIKEEINGIGGGSIKQPQPPEQPPVTNSYNANSAIIKELKTAIDMANSIRVVVNSGQINKNVINNKVLQITSILQRTIKFINPASGN